MNKKRIAVFASGNGTNAEKIFEYFDGHPTIKVAGLFCNKPEAGVLERAEKYGIPIEVFTWQEFYHSDIVLQKLKNRDIGFIVLAGFMWLIPPTLVAKFPNRIINIHPALLPKFGGKGMYGMHVHKAVKQANERQTGITIHWVNEHYDEGDVIAQFSCSILPEHSPEEIAVKVQRLEHENYPKVIENLVLNKH